MSAARSPLRACAAALIGLVALLASAPAAAHTRSLSYSTWKLRTDGADARSRISRLDFTRLGLDPIGSAHDAQRAAAIVADSLVLRAGGRPCRAHGVPALLDSPEGWVLFAWRVDCESSGGFELATTLLLEVAPSHLHFARIERPGAPAQDLVLSDASRSVELPSALATRGAPSDSAPAAGIARYVEIGVGHILSGADHLAFLAALLLLAASLRELALLVSAFTLAHSLTLGLAWSGWVTPRGDAVEALIGYSIALAAAENAWIAGGRDSGVPRAATALLLGFCATGSGALPRSALAGLALFTACHFALVARSPEPARLRVAIAFGFGLVHGLGFAGVLSELSLAPGRLVAALFGFNLGVEIGQLLAIALAWPLLAAARRALQRRGRSDAALVARASAALCGLGLYWFATRALA